MKCAPYLCAIIVVALSAAWTIAQECCVSCGCNTCVRKVCHVKCETKKVPHTEYCCECEDFCIPGPSKKCGHECTVDCNGCEKCKVNWVPQCATVHTRNKLKKIVTEKEEKTYKWVVETYCEQCATRCVTSEAQLKQMQSVAAAGSLSPRAMATISDTVGAKDTGVQQAAFSLPVPKVSSTQPANPQPAAKSWRDSFKLPWQR